MQQVTMSSGLDRASGAPRRKRSVTASREHSDAREVRLHADAAKRITAVPIGLGHGRHFGNKLNSANQRRKHAMFSLGNQRVLVVGGSAGIGLATGQTGRRRGSATRPAA